MRTTWTLDDLRNAVAESSCYTDVCMLLHIARSGDNTRTIKKHIAENNISITHFKKKASVNNNGKKDVDYYLRIWSKDSAPPNRGLVKQKLFESKYKEKCCEGCNLSTWLGLPIPITLHHINGDNWDNRLENLQILCPNCHTLTDNFAGKKRPANVYTRKIHICPQCGGVRTAKGRVCRSCGDKNKRMHLPDLDELYRLSLQYTYTELGRRYNVSDVTIRKWVLHYKQNMVK